MARTIELTGDARAVLACVWRDLGRGPLGIDPELVAAVEKTMTLRIPDEVLAILVAEKRAPSALVDFTREIVEFYAASFTGDWQRELEFHHVAFARLPGDDSEPLYACFERKTGALFVWDLRHPARGGAPSSLDEYVMLRWAEDPKVELATPPSDADVVAFAPVLAAPAAVPRVPVRKRVSHPAFGEGVVLERRDGKVRVDFGPAGEKLLAERFVTELD